MCKKGYVKIEVVGRSLDRIVNDILEQKENGKSVYVDFNGHTLYSESKPTETKDRLKSIEEEKFEMKDDVRIGELNKLLKKKGRDIIEEKNWEKWEKIIKKETADIFRWSVLCDTIEIIESLLINDFDGAKETFEKQKHSGLTASLTFDMVEEFSEKGKEFRKLMYSGK